MKEIGICLLLTFCLALTDLNASSLIEEGTFRNDSVRKQFVVNRIDSMNNCHSEGVSVIHSDLMEQYSFPKIPGQPELNVLSLADYLEAVLDNRPFDENMGLIEDVESQISTYELSMLYLGKGWCQYPSTLEFFENIEKKSSAYFAHEGGSVYKDLLNFRVVLENYLSTY